MPHIGAIPMLLTKANSEVHFSLGRFSEPQFNEICRTFDEFDKFLETGSTKYGMLYVKSGTNVIFDIETKSKYLDAMSSEDVFNQFVDQMKWEFENARNMDW
jgi:hypothetical protein